MVSIKITPQLAMFFSLPFEKNTLKLTLEVLNANSEFRFPVKPHLSITLRKISFKNELLTIGIILGEEAEERVYLKATKDYLLVGCSVDTNDTYLSRYAYFSLHQMMSIYDHCNFDKYYWPDFFTVKNRTSKYLTIINDRQGMDISLKAKYASFYRPHEKFEPIKLEPTVKRADQVSKENQSIDIDNMEVVGFCLGDAYSRPFYSNRYPFLIPYTGILAFSKNSIKAFMSFITGDVSPPMADFTQTQYELFKLGKKMYSAAQVVKPDYGVSDAQLQAIKLKNQNRCKQLFKLWNEALPYLVSQRYTHHSIIYGLRTFRNKPRKMDMIPCSFSYEAPQIIFLWKDRGEYYELAYRFRVGKKTMKPSENYTSFFITEEDEPMRFYLLQSFSDYQLTDFFAKRKFKVLIMKAHYKDFETYLNWLRSSFDVIYDLKS
jgi:hypothetical protein